MTPHRISLALAAVLVATLAPWAHAAPKGGAPQLTDTCGDQPQESASPGMDIKSFQLSTIGRTTHHKVGHKRVRTYVPTNLIAQLTMCGPVVTAPGVNYTVQADTTACNNGSFEYMYRSYAQSMPKGLYNGDLFILGCGTNAGAGASEFVPDVQAKVSGLTITWNLPLADLGSDLPLGSTFSNFRARSDADDPVTGELGTWFVGSATSGAAGDVDYAHSDASWKLA